MSDRRSEEPPGGDVSLRCPSCGRPNRAGRGFLRGLRHHLGLACRTCGTRNNPDEKFCGACGAALTGAVAEGERRQLTVLFCDLVGSTTIAGQLDPEDWREIAAEYQRAAAATAVRFDGHVAQYLGDGLLIYFGYPQAHEDDAERAVRGGLALLDTVAELNQRFESAHGVRLAVRVGMHTGPVVIGEGAGPGAVVFGETPNIAARVQALADPDAVLITEATHRLVSGRFIVEAKGTPPLKGGAGARGRVSRGAGKRGAESAGGRGVAGPDPVRRTRSGAAPLERALGASPGGGGASGSDRGRGRNRKVAPGADLQGDPGRRASTPGSSASG